MSAWLQNQIKAAEGLLEAVDRQAKSVSKKESLEQSRVFTNAGGEQSISPGIFTNQVRSGLPARQSGLPLPPDGSKQGFQPSTTANKGRGTADSQTQDPPPLASLFGRSSDSSKQLKSSIQEETTGGARTEDHSKHKVAEGNIPDEQHSEALADKEVRENAEDPKAKGAARKDAESTLSPQQKDEDLPSAKMTGDASNREALKSSGAQAKTTVQGDPQVSASDEMAVSSTVVPAPASVGDQRTSTADAIAEAIKAATAATGGAGIEGAEDSDEGVREARLAKMVDNLKRRMEQLRTENQQLEELLQQAEARAAGGSAEMSQLEDGLARARAAESAARAELIQIGAAKGQECEDLRASVQKLKAEKDALSSKLASLQEENTQILQQREASEGRILSSLRAEVVAAERRLEDERFVTAAAIQNFAAREQELEATLSESAATLSSQHRAIEEKTRRLSAAETQLATLKAENSELRSNVDALREQGLRQEEENGASPVREAQFQELQEKLAGLAAALNNSQQQKQRFEAELEASRSELEGLRQQVLSSSSVAELERRMREVTELLYQKQSQLEKMASEKSALQMSFSQELASMRDEAERVKRRGGEPAMAFVDGDLVVPMADMASYQRLVNNKQLGKAVKVGARYLDALTLSIVQFLRRYPLGRLVIFGYVLFVHIFIYLLMHHLQQHAVHSDSPPARFVVD